MKKHDEAAAQYQSAIAVRECYVQAWNGLALAHALKGHGENAEQLQEAFRAAAKAIEINPKYEGSYFLFALLCRESLRSGPRDLIKMEPAAAKLIEEAVVKLRTGSQVRPDSLPILQAHGTACVLWGFGLHGQRKDPGPAVDEAVKVLTAAIARDESRAEPWFARGVAQALRAMADRWNRDGLDKSAADLAEAAKRAPDNAWIQKWIGYQRVLAGDSAGAEAAWRRAIALEPNLRTDLEAEIAELPKKK